MFEKLLEIQTDFFFYKIMRVKMSVEKVLTKVFEYNIVAVRNICDPIVSHLLIHIQVDVSSCNKYTFIINYYYNDI